MSDEREIILHRDGKRYSVKRIDYVTAKTKDLREFGYPNLTEQEVSDQLDAILNDGGELSVIGMFMQDEIKPA